MPWYLIELNVGISDKLAKYITDTYSNQGKNIISFEKQGNYTKIVAFANNQTQVNNALQDIRTRLAEVSEILTRIIILKTHKYNIIERIELIKTHIFVVEAAI